MIRQAMFAPNIFISAAYSRERRGPSFFASSSRRTREAEEEERGEGSRCRCKIFVELIRGRPCARRCFVGARITGEKERKYLLSVFDTDSESKLRNAIRENKTFRRYAETACNRAELTVNAV